MRGNLHRRVPDEGSPREVHNEDVPSEHLRQRRDLFGHFVESVESDLRHLGYSDLDPVPAYGPEPQPAGEF